MQVKGKYEMEEKIKELEERISDEEDAAENLECELCWLNTGLFTEVFLWDGPPKRDCWTHSGTEGQIYPAGSFANDSESNVTTVFLRQKQNVCFQDFCPKYFVSKAKGKTKIGRVSFGK